MVTITDQQRRARLIRRHHLDGAAPDGVAAVRAVVAMHSSDPVTPFLGVRARVADATLDTLAGPLYDDRTLWRLHAIRRTLFVATLDDAVLLEAAAGRDVARKERRRVLAWLAAELGDGRAEAWLAQARDRVLAVLDDGTPRPIGELTAAVPELALEVTLGAGRWSTRSPIGARVLFLLAMDGDVVRAAPVASWRTSQYRWAVSGRWFPQVPERREDEASGRAVLASRYLEAYGPATFDDVRWWTGWTVAATRQALARLATTEVILESGATALMLRGDQERARPPAEVVALLPALDPTTMGWKERGWYLGPHGEVLFDRNGNAGPTVWVDGRVIGGWAVGASGEVRYRLLEDIGGEVRGRIDEEAGRLTAWLDGAAVTPRFRTPLERDLTR